MKALPWLLSPGRYCLSVAAWSLFRNRILQVYYHVSPPPVFLRDAWRRSTCVAPLILTPATMTLRFEPGCWRRLLLGDPASTKSAPCGSLRFSRPAQASATPDFWRRTVSCRISTVSIMCTFTCLFATKGNGLAPIPQEPESGHPRNKLQNAIGLFHRRRRAIPAASTKGNPLSANGIAALPHQEPLAA